MTFGYPPPHAGSARYDRPPVKSAGLTHISTAMHSTGSPSMTAQGLTPSAKDCGRGRRSRDAAPSPSDSINEIPSRRLGQYSHPRPSVSMQDPRLPNRRTETPVRHAPQKPPAQSARPFSSCDPKSQSTKTEIPPRRPADPRLRAGSHPNPPSRVHPAG